MVIALAIFAGYCLVAGRLDRRSITAPIVLVASGAVLGEAVLNVWHVSAGAEPAWVFLISLLILYSHFVQSRERSRASNDRERAG